MSETNKALMKRFVVEYQGGRDEAVLDEVISPDVVDHSAFPGQAPGRAGVKALFDSLHAGIGGLHADIEDQIAEGDRVVTRKTLRGTHTGELFGVPATGRELAFGVIDIVRIERGQVVEHWNQIDRLGLFQQLGVVPVS